MNTVGKGGWQADKHYWQGRVAGRQALVGWGAEAGERGSSGTLLCRAVQHCKMADRPVFPPAPQPQPASHALSAHLNSA